MRLNAYSDHVSNAKALFSYKIRAIILSDDGTYRVTAKLIFFFRSTIKERCRKTFTVIYCNLGCNRDYIYVGSAASYRFNQHYFISSERGAITAISIFFLLLRKLIFVN